MLCLYVCDQRTAAHLAQFAGAYLLLTPCLEAFKPAHLQQQQQQQQQTCSFASTSHQRALQVVTRAPNTSCDVVSCAHRVAKETAQDTFSPYTVYDTLPGVAHFGSYRACAEMNCLHSHSICCSSCSLLTSRLAGCSVHVDFVPWRAPHAAAASEYSHRCCGICTLPYHPYLLSFSHEAVVHLSQL
jgi:hypothetical protein